MMAVMFFGIFTVLSFYIIAVSAYLLLITIGAHLFAKKVKYGEKRLRLAVVIPAHNEEEHIGTTVRRVRESTYPSKLYSVFVIADNCSDRTEERARQAGARVFPRTDLVKRGKGQALDWFFRKQKQVYEKFDGVVIMDADTCMHKNFLEEIAGSLEYPGVKAVQGYYGVSNAHEHWRSGLLSAAFTVFNHLRPAGHNAVGGTAGLRGNGMAFRTRLLAETGWPAHSIVEDYEFSLTLLLRGIVVHYNPDAVVTSDMPTDSKVAETQRMRWEGIDFGTKKKLISQVFRALIEKPKPYYLDALMDFFVPPLALVVVGQLLVFCGAAMLRSFLTIPLGICIGITFFYVLSGMILRKATWAEWSSLIKSPLYILWKIPVYIRMRNFDSTVWQRTKRASELNNTELPKKITI